MDMNPDQRMIDAQAKRISKLNDEVRSLKEQVVEGNAAKTKAAQYDLIVKSMKDNENLREEFQRFLMLCKMSIEEPVPGLTESKRTHHSHDAGMW